MVKRFWMQFNMNWSKWLLSNIGSVVVSTCLHTSHKNRGGGEEETLEAGSSCVCRKLNTMSVCCAHFQNSVLNSTKQTRYCLKQSAGKSSHTQEKQRSNSHDSKYSHKGPPCEAVPCLLGLTRCLDVPRGVRACCVVWICVRMHVRVSGQHRCVPYTWRWMLGTYVHVQTEGCTSPPCTYTVGLCR